MDVTIASIIMVLGALAVILVIVLAIWSVVKLKRNATRAGYDSIGEYLKSPPRTDREKRDAINLALKGLVVCLFGLIFPPCLIIGVFPLFYGLRKTMYSSLGLGLVNDAEEDAPVA
jgi:hypothetical protein